MVNDPARTRFTLWEVMFSTHNLYTLLSVTGRTRLGPTRAHPVGLLDRLHWLQEDLGNFRLSDSERAIRDDLDRFVSEMIDAEPLPHCLGPARARQLRNIVKSLIKALEEEASGRTLFLAACRRNIL